MFIRVETINKNTKRTVGGYLGTAYAMLAIKLGIKPTDSGEVLAKHLSQTKDPDVINLWYLIEELSQLKQPEVYINNKENHCCLYTEDKFFEEADLLIGLDSCIEEASKDEFRLIYAFYDFDEDEILYNDGEQIVVDRETLEMYRDDLDYLPIEDAGIFSSGLLQEACFEGTW